MGAMSRLVLAIALLLMPAVLHAAPQKPAHARKPVDVLFAELAQARSPEEAKPIEDQIEAIFQQSGSATIDLLMSRAAAAEKTQDLDTARKLLNDIVQIAPGYAEGWRRLGELEALSNDDTGAMLALQKAVTLNPRHFAAMSELADMLQDYGDKKAALGVLRKVQALDPTYENVDRRVRELAKDVEGQGI